MRFRGSTSRRRDMEIDDRAVVDGGFEVGTEMRGDAEDTEAEGAEVNDGIKIGREAEIVEREELEATAVG